MTRRARVMEPASGQDRGMRKSGSGPGPERSGHGRLEVFPEREGPVGARRHQEVLAMGGVQELVETSLRAHVEVEAGSGRVMPAHGLPGPVKGVAGGSEGDEMQAGEIPQGM